MLKTQPNKSQTKAKQVSQQKNQRPSNSSKVHLISQTQSKRANTSPGPGSYKIKSMFQNRTGFSIPSASPAQMKNQKPDPWTYIPNDLSIKPKSKITSFGKQQRLEKQKQGPSPTHYKTNYNVVFHSIRSPIFRAQKKFFTKHKEAPGPGKYDLLKFDTLQSNPHSVKIGKQKRNKEDKLKQIIPGPNFYQTQNDFDQGVRKMRGYSIGQRLKYRTESDLPLNYLKYNNSKQAVMPKGPAFKFKKSTKHEQISAVSPGPAQYYPANHQQRGVVIGKSLRKLHNITGNPGPESYRTQHPEQGPSYSIPKSKNHLLLHSERTPGPGLYSPELPESQKYKSISIGIGDRSNLGKNQKLPGPGEYNIPMNSTGGFSIGREEKKADYNNKPGPRPLLC